MVNNTGDRDDAVFTIKDFSCIYPITKTRVSIKGEIRIQPGEKLLIKGPSGCGKSTLLLALSGLIPGEIYAKLGGNILYQGIPIQEVNPILLHQKVGVVFQNPYTQRVTGSIEDELAFYLENLGYPSDEIENRLQAFIDDFHLRHLLKHKPSHLSGGEIQLLMLASVLIADPEVLLLDEPTSYLDIKSECSFYRYLKQYTSNKTVLLIDHKLNKNTEIITRVVELNNKGKIIYDGSPQTFLLNRYQKNNPPMTSPFTESPVPIHLNRKNEKTTIQVKHVSFSYEPDKPLLKDVSLTLIAGKVTSIFGLNGSGKTTLLKIIARLLKRHSFDIQLNGVHNPRKSNYYARVGVIFQNPESHFLFSTVIDEISNGSPKNRPTKDYLKFFDITTNARQNPFSLSEGQKRRLNLAHTFYWNHSLILMDEPTFGQDEQNVKHLESLISQLKYSGIGFLIITHDLDFIRKVSDEIYWLNKGRLKKIYRWRQLQEYDDELCKEPYEELHYEVS